MTAPLRPHVVERAQRACQWPAGTARSLAACVSLVPTAPVWAALCAARTASHAATATPPPRCGGLRKAPGQRRIARCSAARPCLARVCRDAGHARRCVEGESLCDRPAPAPMWLPALSALPTAERAQLDCPRLPSAQCPQPFCWSRYALRGRRVTR